MSEALGMMDCDECNKELRFSSHYIRFKDGIYCFKCWDQYVQHRTYKEKPNRKWWE